MQNEDCGFRNEWWGSHTSPYQCLAFYSRFVCHPRHKKYTIFVALFYIDHRIRGKLLLYATPKWASISFLVLCYFPVFFSCFLTAFFFYGSCSLLSVRHAVFSVFFSLSFFFHLSSSSSFPVRSTYSSISLLIKMLAYPRSFVQSHSSL